MYFVNRVVILLLIRNTILLHTPDFFGNRRWRAAPYIHDRMAAQKQAVQILSEESLDYYKKKKEQGEDVQIVELSLMKFFLMSLFLRRFFRRKS